ncbi:prolyl 3-hydroxylase OGFOD1 [Eurytemora carolleeae]|uniref:prolyl 3-hydroxylase OGFOD1 n=1 Tax=Eurytemora carolleeae TaxID=1294199 RepID=UPI000C7845CE|nr:prolyl 3-hydroxylase OGFOD1 [Eurytemora carolleeae]|eukprot:XP_023320742.1 prolyl 3-hydroxylase OGFOD1-like [Eurytemora affinis]
MPKHKSKSKNGVASKKSKIADPCNLNPDLVKNKDNYENLFSKQEKFEDSCLTVTNHPFNCCQMKNILEPEFLEKLNHELKGLELKEKNNDLYKFHQSGELNKVQLPALQGFKNMLLEQLKPIISQITGAELDDRLALFYAQYQQTDYLLCHDDELEGRRVAFILYLVPEDWSEKDGGLLELFNTDETGNPSDISVKMVPKNNSLVFFDVSPISFHQVGEVLTDRTRLSIGGWFHGDSLPRPEKPVLTQDLGQTYEDITEELFFSMINPIYLNPVTQSEIQEKFEQSSEISLPEFIQPQRFSAISDELKNLQGWKQEGPPNRRNLKSISNYREDNEVGNIFNLMSSEPFFLLLSNLTGLRLHNLAPEDSDKEEEKTGDGLEQEISPKWKGKIRKWSQGNYTLVRDDDLGQAEYALDARLCFNLASWDPQIGGQTIYIARGEDEELVTVEPENNSLNLVFRDKESMRFVKHVNSRIAENNGPFHDLEFTYYE